MNNGIDVKKTKIGFVSFVGYLKGKRKHNDKSKAKTNLKE